MANLHSLRNEYIKGVLLESNTPKSPIELFEIWFGQVLAAEVYEANAMVLSTTFSDRPSSRVVLLKEIKEEAFVFYTNYTSKKGKIIEMNPQVSLCFFWKELERQVRIEGKAFKIPEAESETYFLSRPIESQIGAIISPQSQKISKEDLENSFKLFDTTHILKPAQWGGYAVIPDYMEFWQGGAHRLHDRIVYELKGDIWEKYRLAP
jgi:pyridoxamine 5'-phosphate oxidase